MKDFYNYSISTKSKGGMDNLPRYALMVLFWFLLSAVVYSILFVVIDNVVFRSKSTAFQSMTQKKKHDYVSRVLSVYHAILVAATSSVACFFIW